ncbi:uncharacterized protein LOC142976094 [Anticarsia gemmatalis]|uniref:uncharacterized protein LOC142976094 n=1 Tax=Anticarsia gemmatalis TaxID=129554 RepID=UPI003F76A263
MAPKKDKGKKEEEKTGGFNEVERTFLELQVAECNRKIARLRTAVDEYETRNEELQKAYDKLDEDRADIIAYLKKTLTVKNEENEELKEKVKGLEEIREIENAQFHKTVSELERNFTIMKDQLSSENKLLAGKLNTLEEFRAIRDDLMKKFEKQEQDFKDQEMKYKRIIYNAEKKFVIGKDKLKKEMEARLLQLAQDFQDATELRVAASTHRVIRENIAINNELDNILSTQQKVAGQNEVFKEKVRQAIIAKELAEEERDTAINKSVVQLKVIDQLTAAFENVKKERGLFERRSYDFETQQVRIQKLTEENEKLTLQVRILEQNLHCKLTDQNKAVVETTKMTKERDKLRKVLKEAAFAIQAALKLDQWAESDPAREVMDRQLLLSHLLEIVSQFREIESSESVHTIASFSKVYDEGDLGFVPKSKKKSVISAASTLAQSLYKQESQKGDVQSSVTSSTFTAQTAETSLHTIPSIQILPEHLSSKSLVPRKESIQSFVTSSQSADSDDQDKESSDQDDGKTDIEKKLLASKAEIQKSILKDLGISSMSIKMSQITQKRSDESIKEKREKSVTIVEEGEVIEKKGVESGDVQSEAGDVKELGEEVAQPGAEETQSRADDGQSGPEELQSVTDDVKSEIDDAATAEDVEDDARETPEAAVGEAVGSPEPQAQEEYMAPKKDKGAVAAAAPSRAQGFAEVDKAMFDLQIADLNRKLARLRKAVDEYEVRNEELQQAYDKLDEDRADIIAYLKKSLNLKNEENQELKDRVKGLEEQREEETKEFNERVAELEKNFTTMKDQLTSENKLLAGKLNTLEEFRAIREDLMRKFDQQEQNFKDQEMKYKRVIYDAEKKFVIGKDKLKREMEGRLLQLAQDFQDASESRIAASTHRVIRENIALNNQLDNLLFTQAKVAEQNEKYKEDERAARNAMEVAESERDKAINKSIVQLKVIDQLTTAFQNVQKDRATQDRKVFDFENLQAKVKKLTKENDNMILQIRILEQNLHASMGEQNKFIVETAKLVKERDKYKKVINDTTFTIQAALKFDQWALIDPTREIMDRKVMLKNILSVINKHREAMRTDSKESLVSFSQVYEKGDLGFVPKPAGIKAQRSRTSISKSQAQESFEDKRSSVTVSLSESSIGSLRTMPSISVLPPEEAAEQASKISIPSFTVTSIHSSKSSSEPEALDSFEALTDVEKQLALSKMEIQKSILKDLALSQTAVSSRSRLVIIGPSSTKLSTVGDLEGETVEGEEGKGEEGEGGEVGEHEEKPEGEGGDGEHDEKDEAADAEEKPAEEAPPPEE